MDFPLTEEEKQKLGGVIIKEPKRGGCSIGVRLDKKLQSISKKCRSDTFLLVITIARLTKM